MNYIYSTLASNTRYATYQDTASDMPVIASSITIRGGAGVADKHFITPRGAVTEVTDAELEALKNNTVFKRHVERGFIVIDTKKQDVEKVVSEMEARDNSAPVVPQDYDEEKDAVVPTDVAEKTSRKKGR